MTPEQSFLVAILEQAVSDLDETDDLVRNEAHSFCFGSGNWAQSRHDVCDAVGIDVEAFTDALRRAGKDKNESRIVRVYNVFTPRHLLELLPDHAFKMRDLDLPYPNAQSRMKKLIEFGVVKKIGRATYKKTGRKLQKMPSLNTYVFAALTAEPQSPATIVQAFMVGERPQELDVRTICLQLVVDGKVVETEPDMFALATSQSKAIAA